MHWVLFLATKRPEQFIPLSITTAEEGTASTFRQVGAGESIRGMQVPDNDVGPSAEEPQARNRWPQLWTAEPWLEANLLGQAGSWYPKQKPKRLGLEVAALNLSSLRCLSQK